MSAGYRFVAGERRPVEVLIFAMDPAHVEEFLRVDHEVWTLGEALSGATREIPLLSKETWLDDSRPGEVTLVFVWDSLAHWDAVADEGLQARLQEEFDARFGHPLRLVKAPHEESERGIHRVSRFERS